MITGNGIAVTGTREGMTEEQYNTFKEIIPSLFDEYGKIFRHGDCIGVDGQAGEIVAFFHPEVKIIVHPPIKTGYRAFFDKFHHAVEPKPYIERDRDMVDLSDFLVGFPKGFEEEIRSGTWTTLRYSRRVGKPRMIIWPDGSHIMEN